MKKLILAIAIFLGASPLWAELMTYQGRLKESGIPVTGNRTFTFEFCDQETGGPGCLAAPGTPAPFAVANGLFKSTITIPSSVNLAAGPWYLRVTVGASVLTPLERLTAVPYSVFASSASYASYAAGAVQRAGDTMTGQLTLEGSTLTVTGGEFSVGGAAFAVKAGNVGIGSAAPSYRLAVSSGAGEAGTIMAVSTGTSDLFWVAGDGAHAIKFYGDGSGLSGVTGAIDDTKVLTTGDTMTGPLQILSDDLAGDTSDFITTGLIISTGGAIQTTGLGHGTAVGNARGMGAVDLQTYRALGTQVASGNYSVLSGGFLNKAVGTYSAVGGGYTNSAEATYAVVGGGIGNAASGQQSVVAGGSNNTASAQYTAVGGGYNNTATLNSAAVAGGSGNDATGTASSIAGGANNAASGIWSAVGGGAYNLASGASAVVPGGAYNGALGDYSLAAGRVSSSTASGAFTWADSEGVTLQNAVADRTVFKNRGGFLVTGSTNTSMTGALDRGVFITGSGLVGVSTGSPQAALDVVSTGTAANVYAQIWRDSTGLVVSSVSSQGVFYGDGSGLTGLSATDPNALPLTGGTLAGALNMNGNLLTSVSTINILNGVVAIVPAGTAGSNANYGVSIGSNAYHNYSSGVGLGRDSYNNYAYGVGVGAATYNNNNYGVGVGSNAAGNYNSGVGLGRDSYNNYDHGTGLGAGANDNRVYGLGAGYEARLNFNYGVGVGAYASGNSNYAVGVGAYSKNNAGYGAALGAYSYAASSSTALGARAKANAELSLALGYNTVNNSTGTASFGDYAVNAPAYLINGAPVLRLGTGTSTLGLGHAAGGLDAGSYNLFVGSAAGYGHTSGGSNVMLGYSAGYQNTTGANNVFIGAAAASTNIGGNQNIVIGSGQLTSAQGSSNELNIGGLIFGQLDSKVVGISTRAPQAALDIVSTATAANVYAQIWRNSSGVVVASITSQGAFASALPVQGDNLGSHNASQRLNMGNFAVWSSSDVTAARYQINGSTVLAALPGTGSLGVGQNAGRLNTSNYGVFVGNEAGYSNAVAEGNTYVGYQAGYANTGGQNSVFLGRLAGRTNTTGDSNTFLGANAGYWNTTGSYNLFLGNRAGNDNTTGSNNAFAGFYAGDGSTTGSNNALMGYRAGLYNATGSANAAFGSDAGRGTTGQSYSSSTLVGYQAGYSLNSSVGNILIGYKAGYSITTGTGNIVIGYEEDVYDPTDNNVLNIGGVLFGELQDRTIGINSFLPPAPVKPQAALDVISTGTASNVYAQIWRDSTGLAVSSVSAQGVFYGDGAGLRNVTAAGAVQKTGDSMTGPLSLNGSGGGAPLKITIAATGDLLTATLSGGATAVIYADGNSVGYFSDQPGHRVGMGAGRTEVLTVTQNRVGANNASPYYTLDVNGPGRFADQVIAGGSVTVAGSAFSVGASTFVVNAGRVGVNWTTPEAALQVSGGAKFLSSAGTSYILTAGSAARPDMFFVSSGGAVGMGDFTGVSVDTAAAVQIASRLTGATNGLEDTRVGLFVESHTDGSLDSDDLLVGANLEATLRGADAPSLVSALRLKVRRESSPTGNVDRAMGLFIDDLQNEAGGTINNTYGIFIGDQSSGSQNNDPYALFSVDPNARSYFAGSVGIARSVIEARLDVAAAGLGADSMGQIWRNFDGTIVSSVSATGVIMANRFVGDGSGLINVPGVQKTGDTMTGALRLPQGTDAVPSLSFSGDENTGFYSPGQDQFAFATAGTERLRVTDAGRLGVGTPAPDAALSVVQSDVAASSYTVHIGTSASAYHLVVTTAGWLGLNTQRPQAPLHLTAATKDEGIVVEHNSNTSEGSYLALLKARGTANSQVLVVDGDNLGVLAFGGYNAAPNDPFPMAAAIVARVDGAPGSYPFTDMPGRLEFMTSTDNTTEPVTRMVIRNDGSVGLSTGIPQAMLDIVSTAAVAQIWRDSGGVVRASMTAAGLFYANIPGLSDKVSRTGDTMVGPLTISAPLTVATADLEADGFDLATTGITISTSGALQTQGFGDGTALPGPRGMGAVDLQTGRTNTAQVAGGAFSVVGGGEGNTVSSGADYAALSGGQGNTASGSYSVVAGGKNNYASNYYSVVGGGYGNTATSVSDNAAAVLSGNSNATRAARSVIAGGSFNLITATSSFVGGGGYNVAHGTYAVIAGGESNTAPGMYSALAGGQKNTANGLHSFVGGGYMNVANGEKSVLGGGTFNTGDAQYGVISGGYQNKMQSSAIYSVIGGGKDNSIAAGMEKAVIVGGSSNTVSGLYGFIGGGGPVNAGDPGNRVQADYSAIVGGSENLADANSWMSFIGGGSENTASGQQSVVAGGWMNTAGAAAEQYAGVVAGWGNKALGGSSFVGAGGGNKATGDNSVVVGGSSNMATGGDSSVPGGSNNTAKGNYSFAAGYRSSSTAAGTFTWSDSQGVVTENAVQDQVRFKARGGFVVSGSTNMADPKFTVTGAGDALLDADRTLSWGMVPAPYITGNDTGDLLAFGLNGGEKMKLQSSQLTLYNASVVLSTNGPNAGIIFQDGSVQTSAAPRVVSIYKPDAEVRTLDGAANLDAHLKFFVGAGERWSFEFNLYVYTTDTTGTADMRVGLTGPTATQLRTQYDLYAENGLTVNAGGVMDAYGEYVVNWTGIVPGVGTRAVIKGTIENGPTAGTVGVIWGQNVSSAVNTTVLKGSYLIAHRLN